jgi:uncharacterized protein (DUF58 family)
VNTEATISTPAELFNRIRRIEIRSSRLVNELFGGRYHSVFKGRGMSYVDTREYIPGDDIRNIHWAVTARLNSPFVKRFTEERELTLLLAVDVSGSLAFGTKSRLKSELAAELVALLSFAALRNNDKIGLLLFSDRVESYLAPRKSKRHALRLIRDVLNHPPRAAGTDLPAALTYLNRLQKKKAVVFLISDFLSAGYEQALSVTQKRHDAVAFVLQDPIEAAWPKAGRLLLQDAESGERGLVAPTTLISRTRLSNLLRKKTEERDRIFKRRNVDHVIFETNKDYVRPLLRFFQERARRFR